MSADTAFLGKLYEEICLALPDELGGKKRLRLDQSKAEYERAKALIPGGIMGSREPDNFIINEYPIYIERGKNGHCWDLDGNEFIDFMLGFGPTTIGMGIPEIDEAIKEKIDNGFCFTIPQRTQNDLAEKLQEIIPGAERSVFCKTGTDANIIAVRIARAYTQKEKILTGDFHGWGDFSQYGPDGGVLQSTRDATIELKYGDLAAYRREAEKGNVACILISTVTSGVMLPVLFDKEFIQGLRAIADEFNIVFICDEVRTGFRFGLDGGISMAGVVPDITCIAKAMGNGYSVGAVCGKKEIMDVLTHPHEQEGTYVTSTYFTNSLEMVAALKTIEYYQEHDVVGALREKGRYYNEGVDRMIAKHGAPLKNIGLDQMPGFAFDTEKLGVELQAKMTVTLFTYLIRSGILIHPWRQQYFAYTHTKEDLDKSLQALDEGLLVVKELYPW
ncbi:glutamate-1-semialdehyde 2,1-aminomutase [Clostridia bacterium]|nr:glutamate-1-semialdehyde 2,1-aminomutase [Clostridia bacterium]